MREILTAYTALLLSGISPSAYIVTLKVHCAGFLAYLLAEMEHMFLNILQYS